MRKKSTDFFHAFPPTEIRDRTKQGENIFPKARDDEATM